MDDLDAEWAGVALVYEWNAERWRAWRRVRGYPRRWLFAGCGAGPVNSTTTLGHLVVHRRALPPPLSWALICAPPPTRRSS